MVDFLPVRSGRMPLNESYGPRLRLARRRAARYSPAEEDNAMTPAVPTAAPPLMTAEEFVRLHGDESGVELVEGRVVRLPMPGSEHGEVCARANYYLMRHAIEHGAGRVMSNDTFIRVGANPDSYRGADVCFMSYARLPKDQPTPKGPLEQPPELVVEVRSPTDRLNPLMGKADEYLAAGVTVVILLDPNTESVAVCRAEEFPQRFSNGDELTLPDVLPGFAVPVRKFFA
jgi:Uma2 family endonuclease